MIVQYSTCYVLDNVFGTGIALPLNVDSRGLPLAESEGVVVDVEDVDDTCITFLADVAEHVDGTGTALPIPEGLSMSLEFI